MFAVFSFTTPLRMTKLSSEEISKIPDLLLSLDDNNQNIALQLLELHPYAIPKLLIPIEVFLAFYPESQLINLVQQVLPGFQLEKSPIYLLHLILNNGDYTHTDKNLFKRFAINELNYRPWLLKTPARAAVYAEVGTIFCQHSDLFEKGLQYYELAINNGAKTSHIMLCYLASLQEKYTANSTLEIHKTQIITHYNQIYQEQPHQDILYNLASFYQHNLNDKLAAIETWKRCIQLYPKFNRAIFALAHFLFEENKWEEAKNFALKSLHLTLSGVYYNLDETYYLLGAIEWKGFQNLPAAETYFEKALEENEFYYQPLQALMELSLENEAYTKAIRWHKLALQESPFDIPLMLQIAELYLEVYDLEQARLYYSEILELNAAYPPALEGLKKIEQL